MAKVDNLHNRPSPLPPEKLPPRSTDRRIRGQRLDISVPVVVSHKGHPIQGYVYSVNISWSGMLLETNFPLSVGDRLTLEFTLPDHDASLTTKARVVHKISEEIPEVATQIGVVFEDLEPNVQRTIAGFVLQRLPTD